MDALAGEGLDAAAADFRDAHLDGSHVTVFHSRTLFHVAVKLARNADELAEVKDAIRVTLGAGEMRIVRPEEAIAFKLLFGTPLDLHDARSMLVRQRGRLDLPRLRALGTRLGVADVLERALADAA